MTTFTIAMLGALVAMCGVAAVFFLRYWRTTRDSFFLWFAGAFACLGASWALLVYDGPASEYMFYIYAIRMLGFLLILAAILFKNRRS